MAYAEPAYRIDSFPQRERDIRVERTGGAARESSTPMLVTVAKMAAVVLVVVAALAFARIALTSATVSTMIDSDAISSDIAQARSTGVSLEMEQSVLANTSAINLAAKRLGMAAPLEVGTIELSPDVVAVTDTGDLSLSGTVKNLVKVQG